MKKRDNYSDFLSFFPVVEPAFTLTESSINHFKDANKYLPDVLTEQYIGSWENDVDKSITEYFPCLRLSSKKKYDAVIYWKAALMKYEYILVTIDKSQKLISRKVISGVFAEKEVIKKSAARIDEDLIIHIMVGASFDEENYDPANSQSIVMEIMDNGEIVVT